MSRTVDVDMGHGHGHAPARPAADRPRWLAGLDTLLGFLVEIPAALLVAAEIVVLLAGVISRYVFHSRSSGRTSSPRSCSCGWRCWARWWRSAAASTCA